MKKAQKLINEEGIFRVSETENYEYWIVRGIEKDVYDIIYNKHTMVYSCSCRNVRLSDCYHIVAVKTMKGDVKDV